MDTPKTIIVYGTSLSAERSFFWRRVSGQWVALLRDWSARQWPGRYCIVNASRWGATSEWGRAHLQRRVLRRQPACVLLEFAINDADVGRGISVAQARANLEAMIAAIHAHSPVCRVMLMLTHPCSGPYARSRPDLDAYYRVYRECGVTVGAEIIDLGPAWRQWLAAHPQALPQYLPDGLHPSALASHELIFPQLRKQLQPLLAGKLESPANPVENARPR